MSNVEQKHVERGGGVAAFRNKGRDVSNSQKVTSKKEDARQVPPRRENNRVRVLMG